MYNEARIDPTTDLIGVARLGVRQGRRRCEVRIEIGRAQRTGATKVEVPRGNSQARVVRLLGIEFTKPLQRQLADAAYPQAQILRARK